MNLGATNLQQLMKLEQVKTLIVVFDYYKYTVSGAVCYLILTEMSMFLTFSGLNIVEQSLWKAVPHYLRRVSNALKKVSFQFELFC